MERKLRMFMRNRNLRIVYLFLFTFFVSVPGLLAQSRLISGTVKSGDDNMALPGASVIIKGTTEGTTTDADGNFKVNASPTDILVVSSIGYARLEIPVNNQTVIDVTLPTDVASLQEVIVIGYGTQERKDVSGAISSVSAEQIAKVPVTTLDQAMQGRSAGVQVTNNDASPGAGITVQIRGIGTFGSTTPLYIIDGYPYAGNLNTLNPNDIASMEILKDASATAIYGSRAANGVVIITTKRGKKDGIQVSFDAFGSVQAKPKEYSVLSAQQFASFATDIATKVGYPVLPEWNNPSSLRNIDWQKEMYQLGSKQNYNLAIRGGNDKVQSSFSVAYMKQNGVIKFSDFIRYNATLNLDYTPNKWLKASTSIKYTRNDGAVRLASGQAGVGNLVKLVPTLTGNPVTDQVKDANGNYGFYPLGASATSGSTNVLADIEQQDRKNGTNTILASAYLEVTPFKGLKIKTNAGINTSDFSGYYFTPSNARALPNPQAYYSQSANNTFEWLWENTISYSKVIGQHSVDFVGGVSAQENTYRTLSIAGNGLPSNVLRDVGSIQALTARTGYQQTWSLASEFARLTYKFKDRYIVTGTVRRDGSSRFGPGYKYGVFPSVAVAWRVKEESFLKGVDFLSDLKIRASVGQTGNQNIDLFRYLAFYGQGDPNNNNGYVFGNPKTFVNGLALVALQNPSLKWESTKQTDIGIDAAFFEGRVSLTADYYDKVSSGFLLTVPTAGQSGFTSASRNVGSIKNNGIELSLGYRNSASEFQWGISGNITTVNNRIQSLTNGLNSVGNFYNLNFPTYGAASWTVFSSSRVGGNVGAFYGFKTDGIFQNQSDIDALNAQATAQNGANTFYQASSTSPGDRKFVDVNHDGRITDDDRVIIGSPIPKWYGGVNFDASYKNFDFSMFWYISYGNQILNYEKRNLQSLATNGGVGIENVGTDFYLNRWTETNPSNTIPRAVRDDVSGNTRPSDAYLEDGSFGRLRNLQFGYTIPASALTRLKITKLRVYVSAQNLVTITKYSGLDPEIGQVTDPNSGNVSVTSSGIDMGNYPTSRSYTLGVNLQF